MKNNIIIILLNLTIALGQFGYPVEDFFGGGIGYSPMYISLDSIPGASRLESLGLKTNDFKDPFVIHGGEGFAHITGKWRVGGYCEIISDENGWMRFHGKRTVIKTRESSLIVGD